MTRMLRLTALAGAIFVGIGGAALTTLVGPPEVMGGPECCKYDSPFLAVRVGQTTLGYTANSQSYLYSSGATVDAQLTTPLFTALGPDASNASLSHCGKWLNSAWVDDAGVVHAYFHQEWHCDYARGDYTNKSVGYGVSTDGGQTFVAAPDPILAGANFSVDHQCGEGDIGAPVRLGDYLYMMFIEWDGPDDRTTVGIARSAVADAGV